MVSNLAPRAFGRDVANAVASAGNIDVHDRKIQRPVAAHNLVGLCHAEPPAAASLVAVLHQARAEPAAAARSLESLPAAAEEDPQNCTGYRADIMRNMVDLARAPEHSRVRDILADQPNVTGKNRRVLVDWLQEVHLKFKLSHETLFLCVSIVDRALHRIKNFQRSSLQLLGVTALYMASKLEVANPPRIGDFVYVTDQACSGRGVVNMELEVLRALDYALVCPSPLQMMSVLLQVSGTDLASRERWLAQYMLELTLPDERFIHTDGVRLAGGATYLMRRLHKLQPAWPAECRDLLGLDEVSVKEVAKQIYEVVPQRNSKSFCRTKFCKERFHKVGTTV